MCTHISDKFVLNAVSSKARYCLGGEDRANSEVRGGEKKALLGFCEKYRVSEDKHSEAQGFTLLTRHTY